MRHRGPLAGVLLLFALAAEACGGTSDTCSPVTLASQAEARLSEITQELDFEPVPPCAFRSGFTVRSVLLQPLPGDPPLPRLTFSVSRGDEKVFTLSETRALVPFTAIPLNTHRLRTSVGGVEASGFAGPSGSGQDLAYLRWRVDGVTYELAGTLGPWLTEADMKAIAEALIATRARDAPASPAAGR